MASSTEGGCPLDSAGDLPPSDHIHLLKEVTNDEEGEEKLVVAEQVPRQPPSGSDKIIHLIRHGQSEYNLHYAQHGTDPMVFDADLTALGVQQAEALIAVLSGLGIELAVTTPLRRAIRTCLLSLPHQQYLGKVDYEVWAEPRELLEASCDLGSDLQVLIKDFPALSFTSLPPVWWFVSDDCDSQDPAQCRHIFKEQGYIEPYDVFKKRVDALAEKLKERQERVIAVYGHGDFFHTFLREHMGIRGKWMENCEIVTGALIT